MQNKRFTFLPLALLLAIVVLPAKATLVGTSVTGSLTFPSDPSNYFDPGYGFVPATGYLNVSGTTVTVSDSAVEFGCDDYASLISADFSHNQLTIRDLNEIAETNNSFQLMFTDSALNGQYLIPKSDSFPLNGFSLVGDAITLDYPGGNPAGRTDTHGDFYSRSRSGAV